MRPDPVIKAAPAPPPKPPAPPPNARVLVAGVLVDVAARKVLHTLSKLPPTFEALDDDTAYLVDRTGEVHAHDVTTGAERWHVKPPHCTAFTTTEHEAHCVDDTHVHALAKKDGALRTIAGTKTIMQVLGLGGHLVVLRSGGALESYVEGTTTVAGTMSTPFHTWPKLVRRGDDVCSAQSVTKGVFAGCWTATLAPRWSSTFVLSKPGEPSTTWHPRVIGPDFLVATTWWSSPLERALVVRLSDGVEVARVEEEIANVVSRDGKTVDGLVAVKKGVRLLDAAGKVLWSAPKVRTDDSAAVAVAGGRIFMAIHSSIAAGATLHAFDGGGAPVWSAVPTLPPIAHSAYANQVTLSVSAGVVAMHGEEAAVEYLSLFEPSSGKAVLEVTRPLW